MLDDQKENKKVLNYDEYDIQSQLISSKCLRNLEFAEKQIKRTQNSSICAQPSFKNSMVQDSQQFGTEKYSQVVSLEQNIISEHLVCLQSNLLKMSEKLFKITFDIDRIEQSNVIYHYYQSSLKQYLIAGKSLIPKDQIRSFILYLQRNVNFQRTLNWIYLNAQPKLGDELILIAHKIMLAYLPIKSVLANIEQILSLVQHPFNLFNIYLDPRLRYLHIAKLYQQKQGTVQFNQQLYQFHQQFLQTILLVLEQYFQNPGYSKALIQIQMQEEKVQHSIITGTMKKKKKIQKIPRRK